MDDLGQFLFLAAGAVGLFTYLSVAHWVDAQSAERQARERFAVLRKIAEQPSDSAKLVLDLLREDGSEGQGDRAEEGGEEPPRWHAGGHDHDGARARTGHHVRDR